MPKHIRIKDGPGFMDILKHGPLLNSSSNRLHFRAHFINAPITDGSWWRRLASDPHIYGDLFIGEIPGEAVAVYGTVMGITRTRWESDREERLNIIFEAQNGDYRRYYLVFEYDAKDRKGHGQLFENEEFFASPMAHLVARHVPWKEGLMERAMEPITYPEKKIFGEE